MVDSSIHSNQENIVPHKRSNRTMVLLRKVKTLGRRSSNNESPQLSTKTAKSRGSKLSKKRSVSVTLPDAPPFEVLWDCFDNGIPHVVAVKHSVEAGDEVSLVSVDKALREMKVVDRPATPIPQSKKGFTCKLHLQIPTPIGIAMSNSYESDWPSDEEGEMTTKAVTTPGKSLGSSIDAFGLNSLFASPVSEQQQERDEQDGQQHRDTDIRDFDNRDGNSPCTSLATSAVVIVVDGEEREGAPDLGSKYRLV